MKPKRIFNRGTVLLTVMLTLLAALAPAAAQDGERISRPGVYQGYSSPIYDGWARFSQYVAVRDGTRLAVDIFRPTLGGVLVEDPLPVIWTHHRYHRADLNPDGTPFALLDQVPALSTMIKHGYVIGVVDVRGGGASFGTRRGEFSPEETQDAYDMTEWFATQPWSSGQIGMFGLSYLGITQYLAASTHPPHLKAIFPMMAMFDMYSFAYPGGVFQENFIRNWGAGNVLLDKVIPAAPVDGDAGGALLDQARREHAGNWNIYPIARTSPYRDSIGPEDTAIFSVFSPSTYLDAVNTSGVAIYTLGGWYDMYPKDAMLWFNNLTVPQKVLLTPWSHNGSGEFDLIAEHLRWFDYWLKGIDNGIMDEPPIYYRVMGTPPDAGWRFADQWPLPEQQPTRYYFQPGPMDIGLTYGGILTLEPPRYEGWDSYPVDYTTTTGPTTRWTDGFSGGFGYPDMAANDAKALTYTTPPLSEPLEVTGHPVVHLWLSADVPDVDIMVYLEVVDMTGYSRYVTEGVLRASYRALGTAPWETSGLPYHSGLQADVAPLTPGEPVELVIDLLPTSLELQPGDRLRIAITGADADTYLTPQTDPPPTLKIGREPAHASYVELPVVP